MEIKPVPFKSEMYQQLVDLRRQILRLPLGLNFTLQDLEEEYNQVHLAAIEHGNVLGGLLLVDEGDKYKLRQMCVAENQQGKSIGSNLLDAAKKLALSYDKIQIYCHAREIAIPFYLKNGYEVYGEKFEEVGIPHYKMRVEF